MPNLNELLNTLDGMIDGYVKKAGLEEEKVLDGDRTDLTPADGQPYEERAKQEKIDNSSANPVDEAHDPNFGEEYNLTEEQLEEKLETTKLAEDILKYYRKAAEEKCKTKPCPAPAKEAFLKNLKEHGAEFLHKCAAMFDEDYNNIAEYYRGAGFAEGTLNKQASYNIGVQQAAQMLKKTASVQPSYDMGVKMAQLAIHKIAADLVAIRPVIQELEAKNLLTQAEKDALTQALASADQISPALIQNATVGLTNADIIAQALIRALEGTQVVNTVPPPITQATITEKMPLDVEEEAKDQLILQAAQKIINKKKKGKK